jgi:hypothetical protein
MKHGNDQSLRVKFSLMSTGIRTATEQPSSTIGNQNYIILPSEALPSFTNSLVDSHSTIYLFILIFLLIKLPLPWPSSGGPA